MKVSEKQFAIWPLEWEDENQSHSCSSPQGIVVRGKKIWLSCKTYLMRGEIIFDEDSMQPKSIVITKQNMKALDAPNHAIRNRRRTTEEEGGREQLQASLSTEDSYGHIGDGDFYYNLHGHNEVWFALTEAKWPRILNGAIARYNAETLEFIDLHVHPSQKDLAWLAVEHSLGYEKHQRYAYTSHWNNVTSLHVFDTDAMKWLTEPSKNSFDIKFDDGTLEEYPYGINFIQGGTISTGNEEMFLIVDDHKTSLVSISLRNTGEDVGSPLKVVDVSHLGLGYEREGIAFSNHGYEEHGQHYLYSLGTRWHSWESKSDPYAEILCLPANYSSFQEEVAHLDDNDHIAKYFGIGFGVGVVVTALIFTAVVCVWRIRNAKKMRLRHLQLQQHRNVSVKSFVAHMCDDD